MKKLNQIWIGCMLLLLAASCEQNLEPYSNADCWLNFVFYDNSGDPVTSAEVDDAMKQSTYSFVTASVAAGEELTTGVVEVEVSTMGFLSDKDRPVTLKQVLTGNNDAVPGVHYVAFDDPAFVDKCYVPANQNKAVIPITLLRDGSLKDGDVTLKFTISENEYFKPGYAAMVERTLYISDLLSQPSNWPVDYVGNYGPLKHQLLMEWTGEAWDEAYITELLSGDKGYLTYLTRWLNEKLAEENKKRLEQGLGVYQESEEDGGEIITF